ncbi:hypothetical protein NL676_004000 [Syzygium grande]|nr:hypothetical protein NL676_004000 [Syzygium grande]
MEEQHKETSSSSKKRRITRVPPKRGQIKARIFKSLVKKVKNWRPWLLRNRAEDAAVSTAVAASWRQQLHSKTRRL